MTLIVRKLPLASVLVVSSLAVLSCGKAAEPPTDPTATPAPVAQATPTPAPAPAPTPVPTPDPQAGLASGPVAQVKVSVHSVETKRGTGVYRDPAKDQAGRFVFYVGEWVILDSTQRNAAGQICRWKKNPRYSWDNFDNMMDVRESSEPFFFKFMVARPGYAIASSIIDGVESNDFEMVAVVKK